MRRRMRMLRARVRAKAVGGEAGARVALGVWAQKGHAWAKWSNHRVKSAADDGGGSGGGGEAERLLTATLAQRLNALDALGYVREGQALAGRWIVLTPRPLHYTQ